VLGARYWKGISDELAELELGDSGDNGGARMVTHPFRPNLCEGDGNIKAHPPMARRDPGTLLGRERGDACRSDHGGLHARWRVGDVDEGGNENTTAPGFCYLGWAAHEQAEVVAMRCARVLKLRGGGGAARRGQWGSAALLRRRLCAQLRK
jgi:hypothetical protein